MKSKAEDTPLLLLATDEVLLHLHPIMLLLWTDAVAMTTETISVKKKKKRLWWSSWLSAIGLIPVVRGHVSQLFLSFLL